jgi:hypothetical protein
MFKMMRRWALAATLCAIVGVCAHAQSTTQGAVAGTIFDATEAIVPNATVVIRNDGTNAEQTLTTDNAGYFRAPQLAPGTYTVTITAPGFSEVRLHNVIVQVNLVTQLDQHLQTGSTTQTVEVTAETPVLNFDSPTFGGHLSNVEIENIPMNNRRWSTLALLTPGATVDTNGFGLIQFRAISPLLNNVQIDGADDNQAFSPKSVAVPAPATPPRRPPSASSPSTAASTRQSLAVPSVASSTRSPRAEPTHFTASYTSTTATRPAPPSSR